MEINNRCRFDWVAILIALIVFIQNPPWPLWNLKMYVIIPFLVIIHLLCRNNGVRNRSGLFVFSLFLLVLAYIVFPLLRGSIIYGSSVAYIYTFYVCTLIPSETLQRALTLISKILGFIIAVSLPCWLIHTFYKPIFPIYNILDLTSMKGSYCLIENYFFFVKNSYFAVNDNFRFNSVFDEAGVLGTLSGLILYGNKYDFTKKYNLLILLGGIFSASMAFAVLTVLGYLFSIPNIIKTQRKSAVLLFLVSFSVFISFISISDVGEGFQRSVINRYENTDVSDMDNRTGESAVKRLDNLDATTLLFGLGKDEFRNSQFTGGSYKLYVLSHGWLVVFVLLLAFISISGNLNRNKLIYLLLLSASFMQRPNAFTSWQILLYSCVMASMSISAVNYKNTRIE